jgi:hypothetical protein
MVPRCYLKMGKGKAIPLSGVTTGPKYCQPERSCIERGKMYIGDGLNVWKRGKNNFGRQKSEAACQVWKQTIISYDGTFVLRISVNVARTASGSTGTKTPSVG